MVKYIFVIILFGILSFTHQVNSKENTIDNFYKDFYFTEYGTIMLNDKQGKENEVKQDLYIFAPLNKNGGYYVGSANFRKYLLTVGSEGYVYLFDKNSSGERRCIFKAKSKSSNEWYKGKISVSCPTDFGQVYYKGDFSQNGGSGIGKVNKCLSGSSDCTGEEITFEFSEYKKSIINKKNKYLNYYILSDPILATKLEENANFCKLHPNASACIMSKEIDEQIAANKSDQIFFCIDSNGDIIKRNKEEFGSCGASMTLVKSNKNKRVVKTNNKKEKFKWKGSENANQVVFNSTNTGGQFLLNKRTSIYDLKDNLIVDLNKDDNVCLCSSQNLKNTKNTTIYLSVCNQNKRPIGKIITAYGTETSSGNTFFYKNIGKKISNTCTASYLAKNEKFIKSKQKNEIVIVNNNIEVNEDTIKPKIIVDNLFESNSSLMAIVKGSISDQSEIAVLTMDGYEIALNNNNFSKEFFVKPKGQEIEIVAIDIHGNKSSKIISLKRQKETIQQVKFDFLNPTKIQNTLNNNKAALIIGVESYENTFTALYAENDALYFNDYANTSLGVPKENIKLLVNNDAERNDTLKVISKWLPTVVKEDQTELFVYFSGHGLASEDGKDLYLLPTDGDPDLLELTALMRNQLFDQISSLNPKSVTVFLDTCYSGATRSDELLVASRPIFIEAEEQEVPTNFTIFSASAGKETAKVLKEAEHGLFSYFMMKGLEGEADSNKDRTITNGELHAFINKNVSRQANQTPQLNGDPNQVLVTW